MHKIGILSDTHGLLRTEVLEKLEGCEVILHGGDINRSEIIERLEKIAPVVVVRGNNDKEWAEGIPEVVGDTIFGLPFYMVHDKKRIPADCSAYSLVVYGHSHKYEEKRVGNTLFLNPGSCGKRRFHQEITMALLYIDDAGEITVEKVLIPQEEKEEKKEKIPANIGEVIPLITREIEAGKTVKQIAKKYKISEQLSEQICRMYLTHPGVDTEGILRRIGL